MAPSAGGGIRLSWQWIAAFLIIVAAIWWIWTVNTAPPRPNNVVTITATQPPPQQQPPPIAAGAPPPLAGAGGAAAGPPPCQGVQVTYKWLTICGAVTMDSQYVYMYRGYIYAPGNLTAFRLAGDTSSCMFSVASSTLYVNCTSMIAVARAR